VKEIERGNGWVSGHPLSLALACFLLPERRTKDLHCSRSPSLLLPPPFQNRYYHYHYYYCYYYYYYNYYYYYYYYYRLPIVMVSITISVGLGVNWGRSNMIAAARHWWCPIVR